MNWRTEVPIDKQSYTIKHTDKVVCIGSCFATEMADRLQQSKFAVLHNPFGVLFHPVAIENALLRIYSLAYYQELELYKYKELYHSWDHHSQFNDTDKDVVLQSINDSLVVANQFLQNTKWLIITLGTSFVYELQASEIPVANCHKVPQKHFSKRLLSQDEIIQSIQTMVTLCTDMSKESLQIVFTVSPVRHIKDGLVENSLSKSLLLNAVHQVKNQHHHVHYFPAYEIMMDELRDYRYYKEDLIHPSTLATDYIWQQFGESYMSSTSNEIISKIQKIHQEINHKPLHEKTLAYKEFLHQTTKKIAEMKKQYPYMNWENELETLKIKMQNAY